MKGYRQPTGNKKETCSLSIERSMTQSPIQLPDINLAGFSSHMYPFYLVCIVVIMLEAFHAALQFHHGIDPSFGHCEIYLEYMPLIFHCHGTSSRF